MNGERIRDLAQLDAGRGIDTLQCRLWIYEACEKLSVMYQSACVQATKSVDAEAGVWTELEIENNRGVFRVTDKHGKDCSSYDIRLEGEKVMVMFPETGTFTVYAFVPAPILSSLSEFPQLNSAYHQALAKYVAAKKRFATNRRDPVGQNLIVEFYQLVNDADDTIKRMKKKNARIPARLFR